jgi:hypothetical protein
MAQIRKMYRTFEDLCKWLRERDVLEFHENKPVLVFPSKIGEVRLEQFGRGIHRPYKFLVGDEELCCAYPRKMNQYLLAWWAGFSISTEVNQ